MRFHWVKRRDPSESCGNKQVYSQSTFILKATLKAHFRSYLLNYPKVTENISDDMYVDDLASGGNTDGKVEVVKQKFEELFKKVVSIYTSEILTYRDYKILKQLPQMCLFMQSQCFKTVQVKLKY